MAQVDKQLAARKRQGQAQAALVAVDPRTGEILALVGGRVVQPVAVQPRGRWRGGSRDRSSSRSSISRRSRRWPTRAAADLTPATIVVDEPTIFKDGEKDYAPANYQDEYDGPITLRRALAHSRNIVADQGRRDGRLRPRRGALEARSASAAPAKRVPVDRARRLRSHAARDGRGVHAVHQRRRRPAAPGRHADRRGRQDATIEPPANRVRSRAPDTTFLVTNMMRSVLNEGTGAGARAPGFALDAAGKTGTTNDLRDAWFIGFTPELLTAVWVGFDDNQPIGLSGSQAALPIWTAFMKTRAGRPAEHPVRVPRRHRVRRTSTRTPASSPRRSCPRVVNEAFLAGHGARRSPCEVHGGDASASIFSKLGGLFRRVIR